MATSNKANFVEGTRLLFSHWPELNFAVSNQLGGIDSESKALDLEARLVRYFGTGINSTEHEECNINREELVVII
jgi:hypothetical protein